VEVDEGGAGGGGGARAGEVDGGRGGGTALDEVGKRGNAGRVYTATGYL
jgi:hypothetical protein